MPPRILALWSAARSRSTAFARMMTERDDIDVLHEPFSLTVDFGQSTVGGEQVRDEAGLIAALRRTAERRPVFFKDTTDFPYPGLLADRGFLAEVTHSFLIRDPAEVIASHFSLNAALTSPEVGIERLSEIYDAVVEASGREPVVINSADLVAHPADTVRAYCAAVGLKFLPHTLSWQAEMRPEWQQTSRWHELTSRTRGFDATPSHYRETVDNNEMLARFHAHHLPFYERLNAKRLAIGA